MSKYTPMDLRHYTVPELRAMAKEAPANIPAGGFSKLRKAELIDFIVAAYETDELLSRAEQAEEELAGDDDMTGHWAEQGAGVDPDTYAVAAVDEVIKEELDDVAPTTAELAHVVDNLADMREPARKLGRLAWSGMQATVRSMGHMVRGKVVDTVLRQPNPDGTGRVCLVVEHVAQAKDVGDERTWQTLALASPRRTLHALVDVKLEPLAS